MPSLPPQLVVRLRESHFISTGNPLVAIPLNAAML
jgi:hypothetical protein